VVKQQFFANISETVMVTFSQKKMADGYIVQHDNMDQC